MSINEQELLRQAEQWLKKYTGQFEQKRDGGKLVWIVIFRDFPGCRGKSESQIQAYEEAKGRVLEILKYLLRKGEQPPEPGTVISPFQAKLHVRLPLFLCEWIAERAEKTKTSMQRVVTETIVRGIANYDKERIPHIRPHSGQLLLHVVDHVKESLQVVADRERITVNTLVAMFVNDFKNQN
jgi:predicted HicB family RNase H-like nuclease